MKNKFLSVFIIVGIVTISLLLIYAIFNIRQTQIDNTPILQEVKRNTKAVKHVSEQVKDCVTIKGKCYEHNIEATKSAVTSIGRVTVLAAACSSNYELFNMSENQRVIRIQRCIVAHLPKDESDGEN